MKWNENDTKYILKRIILYLIFTGIVFFAGSKCAKASVISSDYIANPQSVKTITGVGYTTLNVKSNYTTNGVFKGAGQGYIIFTMYYAPPNSGSYDPITEIQLGNSSSLYNCNIGNQLWYYDNNTQRIVLTLNCPVDTTNEGIKYIKVFYREQKTVYATFSDIMTMVTEQSDANAIVNGINNTLQQQITQGNTNTQAIVDSVNGMIYYSNQNANQAHIDSQAQQYAINNNTQAINDLNDTINSDFTFDSSFLDALDLFGDDTDFVRQIIMFPFTILTNIAFSLTSNSCSPYTLGTLYGTTLTLPCINWRSFVGDGIYILIDTIFGMVVLFGIITYIKKVFEFLLSIGQKGADAFNVEVFK